MAFRMYQAKALNSKWNKFIQNKGERERGRMSLNIYNQRHGFMSLDNNNHQKYRNDRRKAQIKTVHKYENIIFGSLYSDTSIYNFCGALDLNIKQLLWGALDLNIKQLLWSTGFEH
jgi:hypothetical protein